jgi:signal transduction histidine kinase
VLSVNALLLGIGKMLPRLLGEDIETSIDTTATGNVKADASMIEQVIMNLGVNARDAMANGGKLIIKTEDASLDRAYSVRHGAPIPPRDYVMLSVTDTGTGMDLETQSHMV